MSLCLLEIYLNINLGDLKKRKRNKISRKVNSEIFRLGNIKTWKLKYLENKLPELASYSYKTCEIETFVEQFFEKNGKIIQHSKINFATKKLLHIHVVYYNLNNLTPTTSVFNSKSSKKYKFTYLNKKNLSSKMLLYKLFISLNLFLKNKTKISLTLKEVNKNTLKKLTKIQSRLVRSKLIRLQRYEDENFFKESMDLIFTYANRPKFVILLTKNIAKILNMLEVKKISYYLKFLEEALKVLIRADFLKFGGIKIIVKGRLTRGNRTKTKIISMGKKIPFLKANSNICYGSSTSTNPKGTVGIKVWIFEKKNFSKLKL